MILATHGPHGWNEKVLILQKRTEIVCEKLKALKVDFYRHPNSNIITIKKDFITDTIAHRFGLVPDNHHNPNWYKIVIMDHVTMEKLNPFIEAMENLIVKY